MSNGSETSFFAERQIFAMKKLSLPIAVNTYRATNSTGVLFLVSFFNLVYLYFTYLVNGRDCTMTSWKTHDLTDMVNSSFLNIINSISTV